MAKEKGHCDVWTHRLSSQPIGKTMRHAGSHGSESHKILNEMDTLRMSGRNVALALAGVLVAVSLVKAKPLLENVEIDVEVRGTVGCFSRETNRTYAVGETWGTGPPFMCARIKCTGPNSFSAIPCAAFDAPDCIEEPGDQTAVYPACCPWARCPEDTPDGNPAVNTPKPTDIAWEPEASNTIP